MQPLHVTGSHNLIETEGKWVYLYFILFYFTEFNVSFVWWVIIKHASPPERMSESIPVSSIHGSRSFMFPISRLCTSQSSSIALQPYLAESNPSLLSLDSPHTDPTLPQRCLCMWTIIPKLKLALRHLFCLLYGRRETSRGENVLHSSVSINPVCIPSWGNFDWKKTRDRAAAATSNHSPSAPQRTEHKGKRKQAQARQPPQSRAIINMQSADSEDLGSKFTNLGARGFLNLLRLQSTYNSCSL